MRTDGRTDKSNYSVASLIKRKYLVNAFCLLLWKYVFKVSFYEYYMIFAFKYKIIFILTSQNISKWWNISSNENYIASSFQISKFYYRLTLLLVAGHNYILFWFVEELEAKSNLRLNVPLKAVTRNISQDCLDGVNIPLKKNENKYLKTLKENRWEKEKRNCSFF